MPFSFLTWGRGTTLWHLLPCFSYFLTLRPWCPDSCSSGLGSLSVPGFKCHSRAVGSQSVTPGRPPRFQALLPKDIWQATLAPQIPNGGPHFSPLPASLCFSAGQHILSVIMTVKSFLSPPLMPLRAPLPLPAAWVPAQLLLH